MYRDSPRIDMGNRKRSISVATHQCLRIVYCDTCHWVEFKACIRCQKQAVVTYNVKFICVCSIKETVFLESLQKNWLSLESIQLPSDCWRFFEQRNLKTKLFQFFCTNFVPKKIFHVTNLKKKKEYLYLEISRDKDQIKKRHLTMNKKRKVSKWQLAAPKSVTNFDSQNTKSRLSAPSVISQRPNLMSWSNTAFWDKLDCTDYKDLENIKTDLVQKRIQKLGLKLKVFKKNDNKDFRLIQNPTTGETVCNNFMNLRNQLVIAAGKLVEEIVASADTNIVRRHRWRIQFNSQADWPCGPSLQKDLCDSAAVQCEQVREFVRLNPNFCQVGTGRGISNNMSMLIINMKNISVY